MTTQQTMLASDLRVVERWLSGQGASVEDALQAAGIPMTALTKPRSRIPTAHVGALLTQLSSQYPGEDIGLALAQHHHIMDTHVLGITAISSETGLAALQRLCRYQALVSTHSPLQIIEETDTVTIAKNVVYEGIAEHITQVFLFAVLLHSIRNFTDFPGDPIKVSLYGADEDRLSTYRSVFGPRVSFSAQRGELVLPRKLLVQPISTSNIDVLTANEPMLESLVRAVREGSLLATLKIAILDQLPGHTLTEEEAAASQNMSLRTLQRRLQDEGNRFRVLLDQTRAELAENRLGDPMVGLSEVSYLCGFSEQASFSRAFKRWTGESPSTYRQKRLS